MKDQTIESIRHSLQKLLKQASEECDAGRETGDHAKQDRYTYVRTAMEATLACIEDTIDDKKGYRVGVVQVRGCDDIHRRWHDYEGITATEAIEKYCDQYFPANDVVEVQSRYSVDPSRVYHSQVVREVHYRITEKRPEAMDYARSTNEMDELSRH